MSNRIENTTITRRSRRKMRRPTGVSRRQRKQLGFEPLEDRRVMSADSGVASHGLFDELEVTNYSSATTEGQLRILQRELERYFGQNEVAVAYTTNSFPTDPFLGDQWHLINSGQQVGNPDFQAIFGVVGEDINVAPVWTDEIFGTGVKVAIIDTGVERLHPDLVDNIDPLLQFDAITLDGDANPELAEFDEDFPLPYLLTAGNAHGTSAAGIVAGVSNDLGGTGIAPGAEIVPIRFLTGAFLPELTNAQAFVDAFRYETNQIDITNNSWGPVAIGTDGALGRGLAGPDANQVLALRDSIFFGRNGLGVIHVFSSGNSALDLTSTASYNGFVNSRYTIGVTGVDHDGEYNNVDGTTTGYPEAGASVLVAAPTGSNTLDIVLDGAPGLIVTLNQRRAAGRDVGHARILSI